MEVNRARAHSRGPGLESAACSGITGQSGNRDVAGRSGQGGIGMPTDDRTRKDDGMRRGGRMGLVAAGLSASLLAGCVGAPAPLDFDFDAVLEQTKDNPVFYVQYAHARVCSLLRKAGEAGLDVSDAALGAADLSLNAHPSEKALAAKIAEWPRLVEIAARTGEPHRVAFFLYELAAEFHALWNRGNEEPSLRFLQEGDSATSQAKIAQARAVAVVIASGLGILGVTPVEEMR